MKRIRVSGVYAILGPNGIYVGESLDCWKRGTLATAILLGLECGIIRETPGASRLARVRVEADVAQLFQSRGMPVVSQFLGYAFPDQYAGLRVRHPAPVRPKVTEVQHLADRIIIRTTPKRASAILQVLAGASLQEVGDSMGLTRERIRQYLKDADLVAPKVRKRIAKTSDAVRLAFANRGARQRNSRAKQKERLAIWVPWIRRFVAQSGRAPRYKELAEAVVKTMKASPSYAGTNAGPMLLSYFSRHNRVGARRVVRILHAIYRMAGTKVANPGSPGHIRVSA